MLTRYWYNILVQCTRIAHLSVEYRWYSSIDRSDQHSTVVSTSRDSKNSHDEGEVEDVNKKKVLDYTELVSS